MRDDVEEDKSSSAGAKCHVNTAGLNLEALAHWSFQIEGIFGGHVVKVDLLSCLFDVIVGPVDSSG